MTNIYAAIEIGTANTVLAIGESENGGRLKITSYATIPSSGVRKSQITNITQATQSVKAVIREIEKVQAAKGDTITIANAFLVVTGQHIKCDHFEDTRPLEAERVTAEDIREIEDAVRSKPLPRDRELLDINEQDFAIDNMGGISAPKGMAGRLLKLNAIHIHADHNQLQNARAACENAHLEIREPLFAVTCAADAVLEDHERKNGALVIDFGGGSTGWAVYLDGFLAAAEVIGVGGDHISNDISHAFQATHGQAEWLKINEASATLNSENPSERANLPGTSSIMESRTISRHALNLVTNIRIKETLAIIRERLEDLGLFNRLHEGAVLVGGGAAMRELDALIQSTLGMVSRVGKPTNLDWVDEPKNPAAYAAICGALLYAHRNYEEKPLFPNFFKHLIGGFN